ncbi:hypothetical protein J6590_068439 [Homalodisca vitripennis]|nr:hypothetical protein J6590_068439 [Homalodisca vitripennis]
MLRCSPPPLPHPQGYLRSEQGTGCSNSLARLMRESRVTTVNSWAPSSVSSLRVPEYARIVNEVSQVAVWQVVKYPGRCTTEVIVHGPDIPAVDNYAGCGEG